MRHRFNWGNSGWQMNGLNGSVYVRHNEVIDGASITTVRYHNGEIGTLPSGIIAQGQSFWVKAIGEGSPSLTITEEAKYDTAQCHSATRGSYRNILTVTLTKLSDQAIIPSRNLRRRS